MKVNRVIYSRQSSERRKTKVTGQLFTRKTKKGKEYYYINLSYKDPVSTAWKTKTVSTGLEVLHNKRKAQSLIQEYLQKYSYLEEKPLEAAVDPNIGFTEYMDHWLEGKKSEIKHSTYEGYAGRVRSMKLYFSPANYRLKDITPRILDRFYKWCLTSGKRNQKTGSPEPLSVRSTRSYKSILNAVFSQAIIDEVIRQNPTANVRVHGKKNKEYADEMLFLTKDEASALIHFIESEYPRLTALTFLALYYGFRRSELLGLKWDSIDFKKKTISVKHTVVRVNTIDESDLTKTPAGRRTLVLFPTAINCLEKIKAEQEENQAFYGSSYQNKEGYIFTWEDGRCYDPNYISRTFAKATKKFGRPEITLHKMRHTCVSLLAEMGWNLKKIQYWCGHKDLATTANIYMHFNRQQLNTSADDLAVLSEDCADLF